MKKDSGLVGETTRKDRRGKSNVIINRFKDNPMYHWIKNINIMIRQMRQTEMVGMDRCVAKCLAGLRLARCY